jgi:TonB family protein
MVKSSFLLNEAWAMSIIYICISGVFFYRLLNRLNKIKHTSNEIAIQENGFKLVQLHHSKEAYSFLNTIFIGDQLNGTIRETILEHEKVHVRDYHSFDIIYYEVLHCIFWFNPLFRKLKEFAEENHEYMVDHAITNQDSKQNYIRLISEYSLNKVGYSIGNHFAKPMIIHRLNMLNKLNTKSMKVKFAAPVLLTAILFSIFSCDKIEESSTELVDNFTPTSASVTLDEQGDEIYDEVDSHPRPAGDMASFYQFVSEHLLYPNQARREGVEGRVFLEFIVDTDGSITKVKTIKGIGGGCDAEAERVMKLAAKWSPGVHQGQNVKVRMILPISFKLS